MKKIVLSLMLMCFSFAFVPFQSSAATVNEPVTLPAPTPADSAAARTLLVRLDEIKTTDMSKLNSAEKQAMRKEVKAIKHNLKAIGGGYYISGAALLLVIILLIVLL
jgi:hypothetical protein